MPKIVDHDRRRREIAILTLALMRSEGPEKASIRSIAQRGGLSMGVLTHYFKTKDELVVFTFRWLAEHTFGELERLRNRHRSGLRRLQAAMDAHLPQKSEPAALALWMSLWGRALRTPAFAREHRSYYRRWRGYIRDCLADAVRAREIPPDLDTAEATDLLVAAVDGLWLAMTLEPRRFSQRQRQHLLRRTIGAITATRP
ncbi:MAG: TetR family transcriptional regulator C-terminal domain-containing protein [Proteobacteria bacterium]|nr:TetR family transcriptional regulator C-terminal domain-containing protein [Pseudomonadota bacterium]